MELEDEGPVHQRQGAEARTEGGNRRVVVLQPVQTEKQERHEKADPGPGVPEEGSQRRERPLRALYHVQRHLHHRVLEPFVNRPLAVEDHVQADHHQAQGEEEEVPPGQGLRPALPGNRLARGKALVQQLRGPDLGDHPLRDVREVHVQPLVFRGGVVEEPGDAGDDVADEGLVGDRGGHGQHDVDQDQVRLAQLPPPRHQAEDDVGDDDDDEEVEQGDRNGAVDRHPRPFEHEDAVGSSHPDRHGAGGADADRPPREGRPALFAASLPRPFSRG